MNALARIRPVWVRRLVAAAALAFASVLVAVMLDLPVAASKLPAQVMASLSQSGVDHPVTAVLLNFRSYDTLLEVGVLLLAVFGVLASFEIPDAAAAHVAPTANPLLGPLVRALVPLMLLVAMYLLWAGSHRPGGAFQAGAVLAAAGVLLRLAGMLPTFLPPNALRRATLLAGFVIFLVVGLAAVIAGRGLLEYPREWASGLILLIEVALTISIGGILVGLFMAAPSSAIEENENK